MRESFNDIAMDFDSLFDDVNILTRLEGEALDTILKPLHVRTVLDCACGTGIQSVGLARLGYQVSASDISPQMVACVEQKARAEQLAITTKRADFRDLKPWDGLRFDAVVSSGNSITLLKTKKDILKSIHSMNRITKKPGGVGVVGMHNYFVLRDAVKTTLVRKIRVDEDSGEVLIDLRFFKQERAEVTYLFVRKSRGRWRLKTYTKSYMLLPVEELRLLMLEAGYHTVRLLDISGQREYNNDEWVLAVGLT